MIGDSDVLVRVHAASLHIGDWHVMTGLPYMLRIVGFGLRTPNIRVRGMDVAGTVELIGKNVSQFRFSEAGRMKPSIWTGTCILATLGLAA